VREQLHKTVQRMEERLGTDDFTVPLDLRYGRELKSAEALTLQTVRRFGAVLQGWPDLCAAAADWCATEKGPEQLLS
jgi:hypothetical protein